MEFADHPLGKCYDGDLPSGQALEDASDILLIPRESIERLSHDNIEPAVSCCFQQ